MTQVLDYKDEYSYKKKILNTKSCSFIFFLLKYSLDICLLQTFVELI